MTLEDELFGPEKEAIYRQLALDLNGNFLKGDFYNPIKVDLPFKNWIITIDTNVYTDISNVSSGNPYGGNSEYTRVRTPFIKTGNFEFAITNTSGFDSVAQFFGAQDIIIGDESFDSLFTIKGNDEVMVRNLFSNFSIRHLLMEMDEVNLMIRTQEGILGTKLPENINELFFKAEDIILDEKILKKLVHLFSEVLEQLCVMGCVKREDPEFKL